MRLEANIQVLIKEISNLILALLFTILSKDDQTRWIDQSRKCQWAASVFSAHLLFKRTLSLNKAALL